MLLFERLVFIDVYEQQVSETFYGPSDIHLGPTSVDSLRKMLDQANIKDAVISML
jgi:hypothetical protein